MAEHHSISVGGKDFESLTDPYAKSKSNGNTIAARYNNFRVTFLQGVECFTNFSVLPNLIRVRAKENRQLPVRNQTKY